MAKNKEKVSKHKLAKTLGFSFLFLASAAVAVVAPIAINNNRKLSLNFNHSTNTFEGNKNRIYYYIDNYLQPNSYNLNGSLVVNGKSDILGEDNVALTTNQRSLITVNQAYSEGMFSFKINSNFAYTMRKNNIRYELAYVKPYYTDSTYPCVGLKLYYGEGATYFETIYEYRDTNLYGFAKTVEQTMVDSYANEINKNPSDYFELKESVGKVGDLGLYAKNIKSSDFNLNSPKLNELIKDNFWLSISSVSVDPYNPTRLKIVYSLRYDDGSVLSYSSNQEAYLGTFDVQNGVDDPVSKLDNFIDSNTDWINNLNQYFSFKKPTEDKDREYTIREAYEQGLITFSALENFSIQNKLDNDGIKISFKSFDEEREILKTNPDEYSVSNYEFDSTTPAYRIYITSYYGTPLEQTKSIIIEGLAQENDFKISQEELDMNAMNEYLLQNDLSLYDIFDFDWSSSNPLSLSDYFMNNGATYQDGKYSISFDLVNSLYEKYTAPNSTYDSPFKDKFIFVLIKQDLPTSFSYDGKTYNINEIANKVLSTINDASSFEDQIDSISTSNQESIISINASLVNDRSQSYSKFTNIDPIEISVIKHFESSDSYNYTLVNNVVQWINNNPQDIFVVLNTENGKLNIPKIKELLVKRDYKSIFSSANVYNIPDDVFIFSQLQSEIKIDLDFTYFDTFTMTENEIYNSDNIKVKLKVTINNTTITTNPITKTYQELVDNQ